MKAVILAGGLGTRLSEETVLKPKPMVEIGGRPILWHIMQIYSTQGVNDFVILGGYKVEVIKDYFLNFHFRNSDIVIDIGTNSVEVINKHSADWRITILDTGLHTMTAGRLYRARHLLSEPFFLTYGDGLGDIDLGNLLSSHKKSGACVTMTGVQPEGRFGSIQIDASSGLVSRFSEKPKGDGGWINGGYFVCNKEIFEFIEDDDSQVLEREPLERLASSGELNVYKHFGFWKPMDTLRDKNSLNEQWEKKIAKWKIW